MADYNEVRHSDKFIYATAEERDAYETAIVDGTNIANKREATQEEVDKAVEEIKRTYEKLSGVVIEYVTVTFDPDNGEKPWTSEIESGKTIEEPAAPTKEGYEFKGWALNGEAFDFKSIITTDLTLKAVWEEIVVEPTEFTFDDMFYSGQFDHLRRDIEIGWMRYRYGTDLTKKMLKDANDERTTLDGYIDYARPTVVLMGDITSFKAKKMWKDVLSMEDRDFNLLNGVTTGTKWQLNKLLKSREFKGQDKYFARNAGTIHLIAPIAKPAMFILDKNGRLMNYGEFDIELMKKMVEKAQNAVAIPVADENNAEKTFDSYSKMGLYEGLSDLELERTKKLFGKEIDDKLVINNNHNLVRFEKINRTEKMTVVLFGNYKNKDREEMFEDSKALIDEGFNVKLGLVDGTRWDFERMIKDHNLRNYNNNLFRGALSLRTFTGLKGNAGILLDNEGKVICVFEYNNINQVREMLNK